MNAALARRPIASLYSAVLVAFIVLAFVLQASFVVGLARGSGGAAAPVAVQGVPPVPCANG